VEHHPTAFLTEDFDPIERIPGRHLARDRESWGADARIARAERDPEVATIHERVDLRVVAARGALKMLNMVARL